MNNIAVLRTERDGVEFFTIAATGESGMSQRGLARAAGVSHTAIQKLELALATKISQKALKPIPNKGLNLATKSSSNKLKPSVSKGFTPVTKAPSKWLQPFAGMDLTLSGDYEKNGGAVKVYAAEFCAAVIKHYAYSGSEAAQEFDYQLGIIGLTSYIQSKTGWLPEEFKAAPAAHKKLDQFLSLAWEWDRGVMMMVDWDSYYADLTEDWSFAEERGVSVEIKVENYEVDMSDSWTFFDAVVFSGFNVEEFIKFHDETKQLGLQKHNKDEQVNLFFERNPEIKERQKPYTEKVQKMLSGAKNPQMFKMLFIKAFGSHYDSIYCELENSADNLRAYRLGCADQKEYAEPRFIYCPEYMEGWNA